MLPVSSPICTLPTFIRTRTCPTPKPSESGWDIKACKPGWALKIQVKAVSSYSKTSRVSPIHPGWDELYLMRLDRDFRPEAFWTVKKSDVEWSVGRLAHRTMPRRGQENSGAVTLRGSWPPSCRIGPGPHGTWRAMPASVPQPTGAPDTACRQRRPASPHRCVGCAPYSRVWRQRHGLKDCHTLCRDTGVGVPPQWAVVVPPQWRPGSPPTAWHRARLLPQPQ